MQLQRIGCHTRRLRKQQRRLDRQEYRSRQRQPGQLPVCKSVITACEHSSAGERRLCAACCVLHFVRRESEERRAPSKLCIRLRVPREAMSDVCRSLPTPAAEGDRRSRRCDCEWMCEENTVPGRSDSCWLLSSHLTHITTRGCSCRLNMLLKERCRACRARALPP